MRKDQIALQIWTVRDVLEKDFVAGYKQVAGMGYAGVEIGNTGPMSLPDFKKMLEDLGIKCVGRHYMMDALANDLNRVIDESLELGNPFVTLAVLGIGGETDAGKLREEVAKLNEIAGVVDAAGLRFCYHNHAFEFEKTTDDTLVYDILFGSSSSEKTGAELDVYWAAYGNQDPVAWIRKMTGRVPLLHMKDMEPSTDRTFCEVGAGIIDMPAVVAAGDSVGVEWYIVEQDVCKTDPMACVNLSYKNLANLAM